jgi:hypothetical protein
MNGVQELFQAEIPSKTAENIRKGLKKGAVT